MWGVECEPTQEEEVYPDPDVDLGDYFFLGT